MIAKGMSSVFWLELVYCAAIVFMLSRARRGLKIPEIIKLPGLDAIDEAIGRATEMGRPVHYIPGIAGVDNAQTMASFPVLGHVARQSARYDTEIIVTNRMSVVHPITEEIVREAFAKEGKSDTFKVENVRFLSEDQFAYTSACVGLMLREKPAANFFMGYFAAESLIFAEVGSQTGAIQIAGCAQTTQIPFFVAACDYCLMGEELFAAGAYLSRDPVLVAGLIAQDWAKMFMAIVIILGTLISTVSPKTNWLLDLLRQ